MTDIQCVDCGKCHIGECDHISDSGKMVDPLELIAEAIGQDPRRTVILTYDNSGWHLFQTFESITDGSDIIELNNRYMDTEELIKGIKEIYGKD